MNKIGQAASWIGNGVASLTNAATQFTLQVGAPYYTHKVLAAALENIPLFSGSGTVLPLLGAGVCWFAATQMIKSMKKEDSSINRKIEGIKWFITQGCVKPKRPPATKNSAKIEDASWRANDAYQRAQEQEKQAKAKKTLMEKLREDPNSITDKDLGIADEIANAHKKATGLENRRQKVKSSTTPLHSSASKALSAQGKKVFDELNENPLKTSSTWLQQQIQSKVGSGEGMISREEANKIIRKFNNTQSRGLQEI